LKRPTIKGTEDAYQMICDGCNREMLEICHGPVLEVISSCIRHFVHDVEQPKCPVCGAAPFACSHGNFEEMEEDETAY